MKLKTFNKDNCSSQRTSTDPRMAIAASGAFSFNKAAVEMLDIEVGDPIMLHQDQENTIDWYISKEEEAVNGFALRGDKAKGLAFNSSVLHKTIMDSYHPEYTSGSVTIKEHVEIDGKKYWPLSHASLRHKGQLVAAE